MVIAVWKKGDISFSYNPTSNTIVSVGDTLIVLGNLKQMDKLHKYIEER